MLHGQRRDVHIDAADFAAAALGLVDGVDGVEDVVESFRPDRIRRRPAAAACGPARSRIFISAAISAWVSARRFSVRVAGAKRAVAAFVLAEVGDVERREQHQAVAVNLVLHPPRGGKHFLQQRPGPGFPSAPPRRRRPSPPSAAPWPELRAPGRRRQLRAAASVSADFRLVDEGGVGCCGSVVFIIDPFAFRSVVFAVSAHGRLAGASH